MRWVLGPHPTLSPYGEKDGWKHLHNVVIAVTSQHFDLLDATLVPKCTIDRTKRSRKARIRPELYDRSYKTLAKSLESAGSVR